MGQQGGANHIKTAVNPRFASFLIHHLRTIHIRSTDSTLLTTMAVRNTDVQSISDEDIVFMCTCPSSQTLDGSRRVVKITPHLVVKFGQNVTREEDRNQRFAYQRLRPYVVIPKVHRYFERQRYVAPEQFDGMFLHHGYTITLGYLVMDYVEGEVLNHQNYHESMPMVLKVIEEMQNIESEVPGPTGTGPSRGIFWEDDYPAFENKGQLEDWINERLHLGGTRSSLSSLPLVFCHGDLALRNILRTPDGSICLLDWYSAGFYPRIFELCILELRSLTTAEEGFNNALIQSFVISDQESSELAMIKRAWGNSQRFA